MTIGLHWLAGTAFLELEEVQARLAWLLGESVVILPKAARGYTAGFLIGSVRVSANELRPDMGVHVEVTGTGCEELGGRMLARIVEELELRLTRVDVAIDGCGFTPGDVRDHWRADRVRTRCKVPDDALEERPWRTSDWRSNAKGDTFSMGSRQSSQFARVYDQRGTVRFELEVKHTLAASIGAELVGLVDEPDQFRRLAVGLIRRHVDFVDSTADANRSRCPLLPWWAEFVAGAEVANVTLGGVPVRTPDEIDAWVEHQVAPALAILEHVYGSQRLEQLVKNGRRRWTGRHRASLRAGSAATVPVTA